MCSNVRTQEAAATRKPLTHHQSGAATAGPVFPSVGVQSAFEISRLTVDVDVQRVERRPPRGQRLAHHGTGMLQKAHRAGLRELGGGVLTMKLSAPQRFVCVYVAHSGDDTLVQDGAFHGGSPRPEPPRDIFDVELRVEGITSNVRHGACSPLSDEL